MEIFAVRFRDTKVRSRGQGGCWRVSLSGSGTQIHQPEAGVGWDESKRLPCRVRFPFCGVNASCSAAFQCHFSFTEDISAFSLNTTLLSNLRSPVKMDMVRDAHKGRSRCWFIQGHRVPPAPARGFLGASPGRMTLSCFPFPLPQPRSLVGFMEVLSSSFEPRSPQQPSP